MPKNMTYLPSKMWSDKARAAALAKRRGQAGPPQSATAAAAVAHANALIAGGALNKKPKGKGKGKAAPKAKDPAIAKEKAARQKEHADALAQRAADRTQRQTEHAASQAEHAQRQTEHVADRARQATERAARQKAAADKAKAKAKAGAKPKAGSGAKPDRAVAQARADRQTAKEQATATRENARLAASAANEISTEVMGAAHMLSAGTPINKGQENALIGKGLAKRQKDGKLTLTPRGKAAAQQHADRFNVTKGTPMPVKASARHSAADMQAIKDAHDMSVGQGATCPSPAAKAGARHSAADVGRFQAIHDNAAELCDGVHCIGVGMEMQPAKAIGDVTDPAAMDAAAPIDEEAGELGPDDEENEDEGAGHTGLMIALQVPPDVAAALAIDGGLMAEELHLTLAFLGEAADFQKQQFAILAAVENVIADALPMDATVSGVGRFTTQEDDGTNAFYASIDCPELDAFRAAIIDALDSAKITIDDTHGFTPHITLAYIDAAGDTPGTMPAVEALTFSTVVVAFGDHQVVFPLGDPVADEAALEAEQGSEDVAPVDASAPAPLVAKSLGGDDTMVNYGGALKTLPSGHVGGYLVRFSGQDDPDLTGDFFTADTDFGFSPGETLKTAVYFNHRLPMNTREGGRMSIKEKIGAGTLTMDATGVFIDAVLYNREQYEATLSRMGWSSGTASHLVDREPAGKSMWVKSWQLGLDASITPTPAEPRNGAVPLKSFLADTRSPEAVPKAGRTPATAHAAARAHAASDFLIIVKR